MGNSNEKPQPPPPTVKELVKEFSKSIRKMRSEFTRTMNQLKMNNTKITNEIKKMLAKNEPRANIRIVASGLARNNSHLAKYQRLDAQLADVAFQLNNIATTDTMVNVMKEMTKILKVNEGNLDMKNMQKTMGEFMMAMEKQEIISEQVQDIMDEDGVDVESDEETDKIINEIEAQRVGGGNGGGGLKEVKKDEGLNEFEAQLNNLK
jgi:hypothetical protein